MFSTIYQHFWSIDSESETVANDDCLADNHGSQKSNSTSSYRIDAPPLPETMSAVTRNLVFLLCRDIDEQFIRIRERASEIHEAEGRGMLRFCRREIVVTVKGVIMRHKDTFATTGEIHHSPHPENTSSKNVFLTFPFPVNSKFSFLNVTEPASCYTHSKPTYIDDLTTITNVAHLMFYVCREQTHALEVLVVQHGRLADKWQWHEQYIFYDVAMQFSEFLRELKDTVALFDTLWWHGRARLDLDDILSMYDAFARAVGECIERLMRYEPWDEPKIAAWESRYDTSADPRHLNRLAMERRSTQAPNWVFYLDNGDRT